MRTRNLLGICLLGILACGLAVASDFVTGFEPPVYTGSPAGVPLTPNVPNVPGQDGWYLPAATGALPHLVFTYAGNAWAFPPNPAGGGEQFDAGQANGASGYARAEHLVDFNSADVWVCEYDTCAKFFGDPVLQVNNLSSFSTNPGGGGPYTNQTFIQLNQWMNPGDGSNLWQVGYACHDVNGNQYYVNIPGPLFPGPEWQNLAIDRWYRVSTTFDFTVHYITSVSITDLDTGVKTTVDDPRDPDLPPPDNHYYLWGGPTWNNIPRPTIIRFFVGGASANNTVAFDRVNNAAVPAGCQGDFNCDGLIDFNDIDPFVAVLSGGACCDPTNYNCDVNGNGSVGFDDIDPFVALLSSGATCP